MVVLGVLVVVVEKKVEGENMVAMGWDWIEGCGSFLVFLIFDLRFSLSYVVGKSWGIWPLTNHANRKMDPSGWMDYLSMFIIHELILDMGGVFFFLLFFHNI